jgi:hypothetical protein
MAHKKLPKLPSPCGRGAGGEGHISDKNFKLISSKVEVPAWERYVHSGNFCVKSIAIEVLNTHNF